MSAGSPAANAIERSWLRPEWRPVAFRAAPTLSDGRSSSAHGTPPIAVVPLSGPEPLGPRRHVIDPGSAEKLSPGTVGTVPKSLARPLTLTLDVVRILAPPDRVTIRRESAARRWPPPRQRGRRR